MSQAGPLLTDKPVSKFGYHTFEQIIQRAPVAISITDQKGNILFVNDIFTQITGYRPDELIGKNSSLLSYKSTPRSVYENLWKTISEGHHWQGQLINKRKDGKPYIAEISISQFLDEDQQLCYYAIHRDITEKHHLLLEQKNQFSMFQAVLNAAPIAIALVDDNQVRLFANDRYEKLTTSIQSCPIELLVQQLDEEFGHSSISAFMGSKTQRYKGIHLASHEAVHERWFDYVLVKIPVSATTAETYFEPLNQYYTVIAISERTREKLLVEERRINAVKLMAGDNKYVHAMQEALMATLHQLQGPFNMIESAMTILKRTNAACPGLVAMDEAMGNAVSAMEGIKQAVPERITEAFQPVNMNQVIRDATSIANDDLLLSSTNLELHLAPRLETVNGMPHRLILAMKQLIDNAIDAIQAARKNERHIAISSHMDNGEVKITIEDSGNGVDESVSLKIFEPFFSTKPRHHTGCRGIGLAIVQQVLNEHVATISVTKSDSLGGARIDLTFPGTEW